MSLQVSRFTAAWTEIVSLTPAQHLLSGFLSAVSCLYTKKKTKPNHVDTERFILLSFVFLLVSVSNSFVCLCRPLLPSLRAIFSVLDLMKMDMANFALSSIRPHLLQQSAEYERNKFQEFLEKQPSKETVICCITQAASVKYCVGVY